MFKVPDLKKRDSYRHLNDAMDGLETYVADHIYRSRNKQVSDLSSEYNKALNRIDQKYAQDVDQWVRSYTQIANSAMNKIRPTDAEEYVNQSENLRILFETRLHVIQMCRDQKKQMLTSAYKMKFQCTNC